MVRHPLTHTPSHPPSLPPLPTPSTSPLGVLKRTVLDLTLPPPPSPCPALHHWECVQTHGPGPDSRGAAAATPHRKGAAGAALRPTAAAAAVGGRGSGRCGRPPGCPRWSAPRGRPGRGGTTWHAHTKVGGGRGGGGGHVHAWRRVENGVTYNHPLAAARKFNHSASLPACHCLHARLPSGLPLPPGLSASLPACYCLPATEGLLTACLPATACLLPPESSTLPAASSYGSWLPGSFSVAAYTAAT